MTPIPTDHPELARPGSWPTVLAAIAIGSWPVVILLWFFSGLLWTRLWILILYFEIMVWAIAAVATVGYVAYLLWRRTWLQAAVVAVVGIALVVLLVRPSWEEVFPRVWFAANRDSFSQAERLARAGALQGEIDDYMGAALPPGLDHIAVDGRITTTAPILETEPCDGQPILFAPAWMGIPDGAIGFVHIPCDVPGPLTLDGYADDMCPRIALGDGWWWADGYGCDPLRY